MNSVLLDEQLDQLMLFIIRQADDQGMIDGLNYKFNAAIQCMNAKKVVYGDMNENMLTRNHGIRERAVELREEFVYQEKKRTWPFVEGNIVKNNDRAIIVTKTAEIGADRFSGVLIWVDPNRSPALDDSLGGSSDDWAIGVERISGAFVKVQKIEFETAE